MGHVQYIEPEDDAHWHQMRSSDITSTESAALFGMSPYTTELELFHRKKSKTIQKIDQNQRMRAGKFLEPSIAELVGNELGCRVAPFKVYATDVDDKMGSSFDYEIVDGKFKDWILEIKNVDYLIYRDQWEDDEAPDHIEVQVQHQLELTGRPGVLIAALVGGNDLRIIERERNPKMGLGIRWRIRSFWEDVAVDREPVPDFTRDAEFIISLHQSAGDEIFCADEGDRVSGLIAEYKELRDGLKDLEDKSKAVKAEILSIVGDNYCKVETPTHRISCGEIGDVRVEAYTRAGYRNFKCTKKKEKVK